MLDTIGIILKHRPPLDPGFVPLHELFKAYEAKTTSGGSPAAIAVDRGAGGANVMRFNMENCENPTEADKLAAALLVKSMLWLYGGYRVYVAGSGALASYLADLYRQGGEREFDRGFMAKIYEKPFEVLSVEFDALPSEGGGLARSGVREAHGCRIGFDAGGSDIKVSAVIDGEAIFSEEIVWLPKVNTDPEYHYRHILDAMKLAASKMPRVDGIGVSSAGIFVDNRAMAASLFIKVPEDKFNAHVKDIYIRAAKEIGGVPLAVANDGDVTALAGAMEYGENEILGIAMGTSEAGGYIGADGNITGWLNELAFVPVDANPSAMADEWSGDTGCGVKYFSQDAVIKLAAPAGIELSETATPAEKLKAVQALMAEGDSRARLIYESIGSYLGYSLAYYSRFYSLKRVLLLGRVMSGDGGTVILEKARQVIADEYPSFDIKLELPDEKSRRVGQSVAAASLPEIKR